MFWRKREEKFSVFFPWPGWWALFTGGRQQNTKWKYDVKLAIIQNVIYRRPLHGGPGYCESTGKSKSPPQLWRRSGADGRIRTGDLLITNQLLYQLSYTSIWSFAAWMMAWIGCLTEEMNPAVNWKPGLKDWAENMIAHFSFSVNMNSRGISFNQWTVKAK